MNTRERLSALMGRPAPEAGWHADLDNLDADAGIDTRGGLHNLRRTDPITWHYEDVLTPVHPVGKRIRLHELHRMDNLTDQYTFWLGVEANNFTACACGCGQTENI
jgi:hypothetical protein